MKDRLIELLKKAPLCNKDFDLQYSDGTIAKVADYLLANGVIVPPCKVGDTVYFVFEGDVFGDEITLIEVTESAMYLSTCSERYMLNNGYLYTEMLDRKAYFTKEETKQALKNDFKE